LVFEAVPIRIFRFITPAQAKTAEGVFLFNAGFKVVVFAFGFGLDGGFD